MPRPIVQEITALDKTKGAFSSITRSVTSLKGVLAGLGVAASAGGFLAIGKAAINSADEIQKLSTRLGASTEALSQYRLVAELTGVSFKTLTTGLQRSTRRISEAAAGTGEAQNALRELGLEAQALNQLAPEQQFEILADAFLEVENSADKVRLAVKLFDTEGAALLQTMEGGSAAIREFRQQADDLGLTLSQETADGAAEANDALARLGALGSSIGLTLAKILAPAIATIANWLSQNLPRAVQVALDAFDELQRFVLQVGGVVTSGLGAISGGLAEVAEFAGAPILSKALQRTADDYNNVAQTIAKATVRIDTQNTSQQNLIAGLEAGITFNQLYNAELARGISTTDAATNARKRLTAATREQIDPAQEYLNGLQREAEILGLTSVQLAEYEARERGATQAQVELAAALRSGIDAYNEQNEALERQSEASTKAREELERFAEELRRSIDPTIAITENVEKIKEVFEAGLITLDEYAAAVRKAVGGMKEATQKAAKATEGLSKIGEQLGPTIADSFGDAIVEGKKFSDVLKGLEQDLIRLFTRQLVTKPLATSIGGILQGLGFPSPKAVGGPVEAGRPYVVGENGPELLVPRTSGRIEQGGKGTTINVIVQGVEDATSFMRNRGQIARTAGAALRQAGATV